MRTLLKAGILTGIFTLVAFGSLLAPSITLAQQEGYTPELSAANRLANIMSQLFSRDSSQVPREDAQEFTYQGISCTSVRNGLGPSARCTENQLTGFCEPIVIPTMAEGAAMQGTSCYIQNASGNRVRVGPPNDLRNTFDPEYTFRNPYGTYQTTEVIDEETGERQRENNDTTVGGECSMLNLPACFRNLPGMLLVGIGFLFLHLAGLILFLAGTLFNWVVLRTVFQFGEYFGSSDGMLTAWTVVRDIANIGLLFAFVLIGIMLILNIEGRGGGASAKKAIPRLIIFAVLLNFSLFAAQAVIDVANAFGSSFTTLAQENCDTQATTEQGGGQSLEDCAVNNGISGRIMQAAGLSGIYGDDRAMSDGAAAWSNFSSRPYSYAVSLIMLSIFVLVAALVLLAGAIMLIIRVVILSLLMVTSPIGFAGMVIPGLGKVARDWWQMLLKQAFFAPVFLLLIFISIKLTEGLMGGEATLANAVIADAGNAVAGNVQVVMVFLIVIGFMLGALIAANKFGAVGAKFATNTATSLVLGGASRSMALGVGGGARALRGAIQSSPLRRNALAKGVVQYGLRPLEGTNFDVRRVPLATQALQAAGAGSAATAAKNNSFTDRMRISQENAAKRRAAGKQYDKEVDIIELQQTGADNLSEDQKNLLRKQGEKALAQFGPALNQFAGEITTAQFDALMKGTEITDEQKGELKKARVESLTTAATTLSSADLEAALKNTNFNEVEKDQIKKARFAALSGAAEAAVQAGPQSPQAAQFTQAVKDEVRNLSKKDLDILPTTVVTNTVFLDALSDSQRDDLIASAARTAAEKNAVKASYGYEKINSAFRAAGGGQPAAAAAAAQIQTLQPKQVAKLDKELLTDPQISGALANAAILEALQSESKLSVADRQTIGRNIRANPLAMQNQQVKNYMDGPAGAMW